MLFCYSGARTFSFETVPLRMQTLGTEATFTRNSISARTIESWIYHIRYRTDTHIRVLYKRPHDRVLDLSYQVPYRHTLEFSISARTIDSWIYHIRYRTDTHIRVLYKRPHDRVLDLSYQVPYRHTLEFSISARTIESWIYHIRYRTDTH